jgi:hypothetical protein
VPVVSSPVVVVVVVAPVVDVPVGSLSVALSESDTVDGVVCESLSESVPASLSVADALLPVVGVVVVGGGDVVVSGGSVEVMPPSSLARPLSPHPARVVASASEIRPRAPLPCVPNTIRLPL